MTTDKEPISYSRQVFTQEESIYFQFFLMFYDSKPRITESQLNFLVYLYLYGQDFRNKLVEDNKFVSLSAIKNAQTWLSKFGLIEDVTKQKKRFNTKEYDVSKEIKEILLKDDLQCIISIKIK